VAVFDHHCKWLNNCIGSLNYKSFFLLVLIYEFQLLFTITTGLFIAVQSFLQEDDRALTHSSKVISIAFVVLQIVKFIGLLQLLAWHLWFLREGITTYEYVVELREVLDLKEKRKDGVLTEFQFQQKKQELIQARKNHMMAKKRSKVIVSSSKVLIEENQQDYKDHNFMKDKDSDERNLNMDGSVRLSRYQDIHINNVNDVLDDIRSEEDQKEFSNDSNNYNNSHSLNL